MKAIIANKVKKKTGLQKGKIQLDQLVNSKFENKTSVRRV